MMKFSQKKIDMIENNCNWKKDGNNCENYWFISFLFHRNVSLEIACNNFAVFK